MRLYAWWNGMARQGRTGWTLLVFGTGYVLYFLKARLFETGPAITTGNGSLSSACWCWSCSAPSTSGMAEMRERNQAPCR